MRLLLTPTFARAVKKLHRLHKEDLDLALRSISEQPDLGEAKVGDLLGVRVYKFRMTNQLCLLAYRVLDENSIKLLALGAHENFYRDLKRSSIE